MIITVFDTTLYLIAKSKDMPKVSRWQLTEKAMNRLTNELITGLTSLNKKDQLKKVYLDFFTPTETKMFAKRLQIAKMLLAGKSYQEIRHELKVGYDTIASIANRLERSGDGYRALVSYLSKSY